MLRGGGAAWRTQAGCCAEWGSFEGAIAEATQSLVGALKAQGIKVHTWESHEGHNWSAWRERLSFGLVSLFGTNK